MTPNPTSDQRKRWKAARREEYRLRKNETKEQTAARHAARSAQRKQIRRSRPFTEQGPKGGLSREERYARKAETRFKRVYGITLAERDELIRRQGGRCAICHVELTDGIGDATQVCTDHCHTTGKTRGILCLRCNTGLGQFRDRTDLLEAAREYLLRYK